MPNLPKTTRPAQAEGLQARRPISESMVQELGGAINYLLGLVLPVGTVIESMLTEAQFQAIVGEGWILSDGRSTPGSLYSILTGFTNVPDLGGVFLRGKNNGRPAFDGIIAHGTGNPDGELALGTYQEMTPERHPHNAGRGTQIIDLTDPSHPVPSFPPIGTIEKRTSREYELQNPRSGFTGITGGDETRPNNITVNRFIRIN